MQNQNREQLDKLRHSAAHLLAAAVMDIWPKAKRTIGPPIENGFYYDFDFGNDKVSETDFARIENRMHEMVKKWGGFEKEVLSADEARAEYEGNEYKLELIDGLEKEGEKSFSFYKSGDYRDLCKGGHVENPSRELKHFKLLSVAGAYWRGDEKNKMLTRIYGTAFPTGEELEAHLRELEEAKKRDHRKIGKDLNQFVFSDLVGKGLPILTPKGAVIRKLLENLVYEEETKRGYQHVISPPLAKVDLYRKSGHYPYYKDTMYPVMKVDEEELILRPMTCPHHFMLFKSRPRSYKELPMRIAELASQFRYEKSGELSGLTRVRMFCLADAHIVCTRDQAVGEIKNVLDLIDDINKILRLEKGKDYWYRLSLGDRSDDKKYYKDDRAWEAAEEILRQVLKESKAPYYEAKNEAAFYGPKIDIQVRKVNGQEETAFTVQYDFVMPKRFELSYIDQDGQEKQPIVVHRSSIGAFERTMAFLIEHYAGAFPLWLAPVQVAVIPVSDKSADVAQKVANELAKAQIRTELDLENRPLGAKIRAFTLQKVPYLCIIGDKEVNRSTAGDLYVSVRTREGKDLGLQSLADFKKDIKAQIETRNNI